MALTGEEVAGLRPPGYGVYILDADTYILFADQDGSETRNSGDKDVQTFNLPTNITINSLTTNIIFKPPQAAIVIAGVTTQKTITFSLAFQSKQVVIDVRAGQIDIQ